MNVNESVTSTWQAVPVNRHAPSGMQRMRVLHVVRSLEVGGLERVVCQLATARGVSDTSVACLTTRGDFAETLQRVGGRIYDLAAQRTNRLASVARLGRLLTELQPHVIHCHNSFSHLIGTAASLLAGNIPVVFTKHGTQIPCGSRLGSMVQKGCLRRSHVVAVSGEIRDILARYVPAIERRLHVIPNGIATYPGVSPRHRTALRESLGWKCRDWVFISVSRIVEGKRIQDAIHAFAEVRRRNPQVRLVVVGDGPALAGLKQLARQQRLDDSIEFLGARMDVPDLLVAADAFVLASDNEGLSMAVLEAMAASLPVIATSVGEMSMVVEHERCGVIVPPRSPAAMAAAFEKVASNPKRAREFGIHGRRRVEEHYSVKRAVDRYEQIYRRAVGECVKS